MIAKVDGIWSNEYLKLGVQTNPERVSEDAHYKCRSWAPRNARSYSISDFHNTDYHGRNADTVTSYARFTVRYFTRRDEGQYTI